MSTHTDQRNRAIDEDPAQAAGDGVTVTPDGPAAATWRAKLRTAAGRTGAVAEPVWRDRRIGAAAALGAGALWGALAGWWTPRSPLTTSRRSGRL